MNKAQIVKGVFLAFCLIGMVVLPVAAAPGGNAMSRSGTDPALRAELVGAQGEHRLAIFDVNVAYAGNVTVILGNNNVTTTAMQATLSQISAERPALESAFATQDRTALRTVNQQLLKLWKQFRQEVSAAIREQAGPAGRSGLSVTDIMDDTSSGDAGAFRL